MTFSYNPNLSTNRDYLRSVLSDTVENSGPLPDDCNLQDEELDGYLSKTSSSINQAYVICCNRLASAWSPHAKAVRGTSLAVDAKQVADEWAQRAKDALANPIDGTATAGSFRVFNASTS